MKALLLLSALMMASCGASSDDLTTGEGATGPALAATPDGSNVAPPLVGKPGQLAGSPSFTAAEGWVEEAPNSVDRIVQYRLAGETPEEQVTLAITFWKNGVGPVERNIQRWIDQVGGGVLAAELGDDQRWMTEPSGFLVTSVHVEGAIQPTGDMASDVQSTGNDAILAAFIEKPGAASVWVAKATGSAATVAKHKEAFKAFIAGI